MVVSPETQLWVAGVVLAIQDAVGGDSEARHWLLFDSEDFRRVCELAGACPLKTRRCVRRALKKAQEKRNARDARRREGGAGPGDAGR